MGMGTDRHRDRLGDPAGCVVILTAAQRRTLGNILASGGISYATGPITQGANRLGSIRKSVVADLQRAGLVEFVAGSFYATTAGCVAFGPHVAVIS